VAVQRQLVDALATGEATRRPPTGSSPTA